MNHIIYEIKTGRIAQTCMTPNPSEIDPILQPGQAHMPVTSDVDDARFYVKNGSVHLRPTMGAKLTGATVTGVPVPCAVHINSQRYECSDSTIELEFDQPGTYKVRLECWPYLDKEFTVET